MADFIDSEAEESEVRMFLKSYTHLFVNASIPMLIMWFLLTGGRGVDRKGKE